MTAYQLCCVLDTAANTAKPPYGFVQDTTADAADYPTSCVISTTADAAECGRVWQPCG